MALAMFFCNESAICCNCCFCPESVFHFSILSLPILTLAELVACWICSTIAFRSEPCEAAGLGEGCVCGCAIAPYPAQNRKRMIAANAVFMGEHTPALLEMRPADLRVTSLRAFNRPPQRAYSLKRHSIEYTKASGPCRAG